MARASGPNCENDVDQVKAQVCRAPGGLPLSQVITEVAMDSPQEGDYVGTLCRKKLDHGR